MKKALLLFTLAVLLFSGCKKDDENQSYNGNFTLNGQAYNVTNMGWFEISLGVNGPLVTTYNIFGANEAETCNLALTLTSKTTGERTISTNNLVTLKIGEDTYVSVSGKINITKFEGKIASGTFDCQFLKQGTTQTAASKGKFDAQIMTAMLK